MSDLGQLTDELEQRLRAAHQRYANYLDMMIVTRPLWGGGFDVLGEIYPTAESAEEARCAAVMQRLIAIHSQQL